MNKLLIVDDEIIFRRGLRSLIEKTFKNICVIEAENGIDALHIIENESVDAMLLDINMPKINGFELLEMLEKKGHRKIPTVIISGYDDFEYARRAIRNSVIDYLLKPLTPAEAEEVIQKLLKKVEKEKAEKTECILNSEKNYSPIVLKVIEYVTDHFSEDFSIAQLADKLKYNANYLSQVFKSEAGLKLNDYIRNYRIEQAKQMLQSTTIKINDIACHVGIPNSQYFSTVFKNTVGVSPQEYREKANEM